MNFAVGSVVVVASTLWIGRVSYTYKKHSIAENLEALRECEGVSRDQAQLSRDNASMYRKYIMEAEAYETVADQEEEALSSVWKTLTRRVPISLNEIEAKAAQDWLLYLNR